MPTELHDAHQRWAIDALVEWTQDGLLSREEQRALDAGVGTTFDGFTGVYQGSYKEPDFFFRADNDDFPSIVMESGWSESLPYLRADKDLWIKGNDFVQLVILLKWHNVSGGRVKGSAEIWRRNGTGNLATTEMCIGGGMVSHGRCGLGQSTTPTGFNLSHGFQANLYIPTSHHSHPGIYPAIEKPLSFNQRSSYHSQHFTLYRASQTSTTTLKLLLHTFTLHFSPRKEQLRKCLNGARKPRSSPAVTPSTLEARPSTVSIIALQLAPEPSGIPEVPTGHKFPPTSPPTNVSATAAASAVVADQFRSSPKAPGCDGEAVQTITEECERLFCDTLWAMFLGERQLAPQQSLVIGATHNDNNNNNKGVNVSEIARKRAVGRIQNFIEVWDYAGDTIYRGFVAADGNRRTLFVFFDNHICAGQGLKSGLMALFEIGSMTDLGCSEMVACVDRSMDEVELDAVIRNLGWVGFELSTLRDWVVPAAKGQFISNRWLFMTVEI
ncbi:ornithine decarboxylase antizyme [Histoplasma capsulatum G186AR]|uniref:Ornithine decarboxylase antizyme n=3 Tax=Ajellomyces capsulatus TaxID=5037 RepID=C0NCH4_AJECG|nr:ornithine decarboxylase antizyme [Histoplasma capsulatum G186AR]EEH11365.1 ornithine decarboxylase antizyme [Histoplasma capsulatum G186AR]